MLIVWAMATGASALPAVAPIAPPAVAAKVAVARRLGVPAAVRELVRTSKIVDLPRSARTENWTVRVAGNNREAGSCAHAALCNCFKMQGRYDLAEWWAANHGGGAALKENTSCDSLEAGLKRAGLDYRIGNDEAFLEWTCRTRRGCVVPCVRGEYRCPDCGKTHKALHAINLVGLNAQYAWLIGVNDVEQIHRMARADFIADWKNAGGYALTPMVGTPQPPKPWIQAFPQATPPPAKE